MHGRRRPACGMGLMCPFVLSINQDSRLNTDTRQQVNTRLLLVLCALLAAGVFALDLVSPLGVASGIAYVALGPVLLGLWLPWRRAIFFLAVLSTTLILASYALSPAPVSADWVVVANRVLSIGAVWMTAALGFLYKEAGRRLRENETRLRAVTDTAMDAIMVIDAAGIIRMVNPACKTLFGYSPGELVGRNVSMLMPSPDREQHDGYLRRYLETGEKHIIGAGREVEAVRRDGTVFPAHIAVGEAEISGERVFVGTLHNLSTRRAAERRLQELQSELYRTARLGELGEMTAAIAHEINQPLAAVSTYIGASMRTLRRAGLEIPANVADMLDRAVKQVLRAGDVIHQIRTLARSGQEHRAVEDLNVLVREVLGLALTGSAEQGIRVSIDLDDALPRCVVSRVQIQQVVLNVVRNAVDALRDCQQRELSVRTGLDGAGQLEFVVEDTGPGLAEEVRARLFQPFLTTKPGGMGIGLSAAHSIIGEHGGRLWTEPRNGGGTVFKFTLPAAQAGVETETVPGLEK